MSVYINNMKYTDLRGFMSMLEQRGELVRDEAIDRLAAPFYLYAYGGDRKAAARLRVDAIATGRCQLSWLPGDNYRGGWGAGDLLMVRVSWPGLL